MKNILSSSKILRTLLIVTIISMGLYIYMIARPVSYGMGYHTETEYEGESFEGTMKFYPDRTFTNFNTNYGTEMESRYYCKGGYVFFTLAQDEEEYNAEVAYICENFEEAVNTPFYAVKTNAFKQFFVGSDGYELVYTCGSAIVLAVVFGVVELILISLTAASFVVCKKSTPKE